MQLDDNLPHTADQLVHRDAPASCSLHGPQPEKFNDPKVTAKGEARARVPFKGYETVWFNTGTLCNIACINCYIESSPRNDRLVYLTRVEVRTFLDEAGLLQNRPAEIGFTGGEPFLNPDFIGMLDDSLAAGFRVLILTNAMKPMQHKKLQLLQLQRRYPGRIQVRVSIDHYARDGHEKIRGPGTWSPTVAGLSWLSANGFDLAIAGRLSWPESEREIRSGYRDLFASLGLGIDADDPARLVLFPEMSDSKDVPEISEGCWRILGKSPSDVMCSNSRMVVKRKGAERPVVVACTLLPYAQAFEMGGTLAQAQGPVSLNHSHCARFCVLGGASCSVQK